jgi:hypothetical protein
MLAKCVTIFVASIGLENPVLRRRVNICLAAYTAKDEYEIMVVDVVMVDYNMDLNVLKGNFIIFCKLGISIFD